MNKALMAVPGQGQIQIVLKGSLSPRNRCQVPPKGPPKGRYHFEVTEARNVKVGIRNGKKRIEEPSLGGS